MGLTIHYKFKTETDSHMKAYKLIDKLHQVALTLPWVQVNPIRELNQTQLDNTDATDPLFFLKISAAKILITEGEIQKISPTAFIGWTAHVAEGCESLKIFLCRYPGSQVWEAQSFCKTQYAALQESGGILNFLRAHTSIILLLDEVQKLGILEEVVDESHYWEHRDLKKLIEEIKAWQGLTDSVGEIFEQISRNSLFNDYNK